MALTLITDPFFYAVAVPAVMLLGISKSGFGAGFGSLAVPMMALAVTVPQAAAILMPVLLVMDLMGMAAFRRMSTAGCCVFCCRSVWWAWGSAPCCSGCWTPTWWRASSGGSRCCFWRSGCCFRRGRTVRPLRAGWERC
jgi:hypothetical protein